MRCNAGAPVGRVLGLGIVVACSLLAGCAMKASTLPKVTLGNTGCQPEALAVFNYDANTRSWMAVCGEALYSCSDAGRRTARCNAMAETAATPEIRRRAPLLLKLPRDVRNRFVSTDVTLGSFSDFVWRLALIARMTATQVADLRDPVYLYVPHDLPERTALQSCGQNLLYKVSVHAPSGKTRVSLHKQTTLTGHCFSKASEHVRVPPEQRELGHVYFYTGPANARILTALTSGGASSPPSHAEATSAPGAAADSGPTGAAPSDIEAGIRAHLDAHREDVLACVNAPRAVLQVAYAPDGQALVSLQGADAGGPLEGCVRAVLGAIPVQGAEEPGTVVHLVR
jgi:hypothetical protein